MHPNPSFTRLPFHGRSGYLIPAGDAPGDLALGHTASLPAWSDAHLHLHPQSEEAYLLLQGELLFWVAGDCLSLRRNELLLVRPGVAHAVLGGQGPVEHFGMRAPGVQDKQITAPLPQPSPAPAAEDERQLVREWGLRLALDDPRNHNCWLLGYGSARFPSAHLILAYLDFPTLQAPGASPGERHQPHAHQIAWEYYAVLAGALSLKIDAEIVEVQAGEILAVPPRACHVLHSRQAPFRGFTLRAPPAPDDKTAC